MLLDTIHSREDLLAVPEQQLPALCEEIRQFLVQNVSRTGGHLASNLGIVETTVAIHRVFDTSRDRLVFDVGHQCYVHKMLTGRMDRSIRSASRAGFPASRSHARACMTRLSPGMRRTRSPSRSAWPAQGRSRAKTIMCWP